MDNILQELRISHNLPQKAMVAVVQEKYPKFDKTMQSKCEREDEYGVQLKPDAMEALFATFAPDILAATKARRKDRHRLTCRISCRLEKDEYELLQQLVAAEWEGTMQDWLSVKVKQLVDQYRRSQI